jgi:hypothetical protein
MARTNRPECYPILPLSVILGNLQVEQEHVETGFGDTVVYVGNWRQLKQT